MSRTETRDVLDLRVPVAAADDLLRANAAALEPATSQKDLADIARLVEVLPALREQLPATIRERLVE